MTNVPLEDNCLDMAIFNLSLMGLNYDQYILEASRTLKLDGQLWIYEAKSRIKNIPEFIKNIELAGFTIIKNFEVNKFIHIWAIKSS
jgi:ubiquinone/menaquinone biosynthesis C-methylase UbiE